ncbi:Ig-like domain-containing protein [Pseudoduganella albidiflava]|uniref:SbsA Ig-like domain-containing protein n=1 Tax=Pseudoduganella albidiflava TaxID=321983 RepID=A0A411X471_9BURK|nr:Ig-like domain-containing protein [Pseudoduganella albidiflava]QBI03683.1 hypothetical protein EYF70_24755 [Pseudoduganella albidiflava]GGY69746.1 hypothetical protein GCM10007387_59650 [Pseudoduganella albidiflava]
MLATDRPFLSAATPADDSGAVATGAHIELTFSTAVKAGSGKIYVTNGATQTYLGRDGLLHTRIVGATDTRAIDIGDTSQVTIAGNKVTIDPAADLLGNMAYSVVMEAGVLVDQAGNAYAGLVDGNRLDFTTAQPGDITPPSVLSLALSDDHLETGEHALLTLTLSEAVSGITLADFAVEGGLLEDLATLDGITWTARLVPDAGSEGSGSVAFAPSAAVDQAGNQGIGAPATASFTYATPASLSLRLWNDSGIDDTDFITNAGSDQGLEIHCALPLGEGDRVQVSVDGAEFIDAQQGEGYGYWFASGLQLAAAEGTLTVRVVDAAGTVRTSVAQQYVVDTAAPEASARAATTALAPDSDSGTAGDGITSAGQPWVVVTLAGKAGYRPGDVIEVQEDGYEGPPAGRTVLQAGYFDAGGNLVSQSVRVQLTGGMLHGAEGIHTFFVRIADVAGNTVPGDYSAQMLQLAIDTTAPTLADTAPDEGDVVEGTLPTITLTFDEEMVLDAATMLVLASDSGDVQEFSGKAGDLLWNGDTRELTLTLKHALDAGTHYRLATQGPLQDAAGNAGWVADSVLLRFDTAQGGDGEVIVVPVTPELSLHVDSASASDPGGEAQDGVTNDVRVDVAGLQPGGSWEYSVNGGESWQAGFADYFKLDPVSATYGEGQVRVRQYEAGPESQVSETGMLGPIAIDLTAPGVTIDYASFDFIAGSSTITGQVMGEFDEGDLVEFTVDRGVTWQRAALDGYLYLHDVELGYGGTIGLRVADEAGNLGGPFFNASTVYVADGYGGAFDIGEGEALFAQAGDDRISAGSTGFAFLDGGEGHDTLDVSQVARTGDAAFAMLDLADIAGHLANIEAIDLGDGGSTAFELAFNTESALAMTGGGPLRIAGGADDKVTLDDSQWLWENGDGEFTTWYNGSVAITVDNDIDLVGNFVLV